MPGARPMTRRVRRPRIRIDGGATSIVRIVSRRMVALVSARAMAASAAIANSPTVCLIAPSTSPDPLERASTLQRLGFTYHVDDLSSDEPMITEVNGKPFVVVPYTLRNNDIARFGAEGPMTAAAFAQELKDEFDQLYAEAVVRPALDVDFCARPHCRHACPREVTG